MANWYPCPGKKAFASPKKRWGLLSGGELPPFPPGNPFVTGSLFGVKEGEAGRFSPVVFGLGAGPLDRATRKAAWTLNENGDDPKKGIGSQRKLLRRFRNLFLSPLFQEPEIRDDREMVGGDDRSQAAADRDSFQFQPSVVVNMVKVHERQDSRVAPGFSENREEADALEMRMEQPGGQAGDPFVEIAENNSSILFVLAFQYFMADQPVSLIAPLRVGRPQVEVVNVQNSPGSRFDVGSQASPFFTPMLGDIVIAG